jgi:hypothetical protein
MNWKTFFKISLLIFMFCITSFVIIPKYDIFKVRDGVYLFNKINGQITQIAVDDRFISIKPPKGFILEESVIDLRKERTEHQRLKRMQ